MDLEKDGQWARLEHGLDADTGPWLGPTEPVMWAVNIPGGRGVRGLSMLFSRPADTSKTIAKQTVSIFFF